MKIVVLLYFILFLCGTNAYSQFADKKKYLIDQLAYQKLNREDQHLLDSLLNEYHLTSVDTLKLSILSLLTDELTDNSVWPKYNQLLLQESTKLLSKKVEISNKLKSRYLHFQNQAYNNMAYFFLMQGKSDSALVYYQKSKIILQQIDDQAGLAAYYNSIAYLYSNQGAIKKGLDLMLKSLKIREKLKDPSSLAATYTNLGYIYKNQQEYKNALNYFEKALEIRKKLKDKAATALVLGHIASIYHSQNDLKKAYQLHLQAYQLSKQTSDLYNTAFHLHNLGAVLQDEKKYKAALNYFNQSMTLRQKTNDQRGICMTLLKIGEIKFSEGKTEEALSFGLRSMKIAKKLKYPLEIASAAELLHKIYKKQHLWKGAYEMYALQITMKDSLVNLETQKEAVKQQMQYDYDKEKLADSLEFNARQAVKDLELKEKKAQIQKQDAELQREALEKYALLAGLFLLALLTSAIFLALRNKRKAHLIISLQKTQVEDQRTELEEKNKEVFDSITYAQRIQQALLNTREITDSLLPSHFILFKPKDIVSGDFYWTAEKDHYLYLAAVDCTGHGVPGAFMSMLGISFLNNILNENIPLSPSEILNKLRQRVIQELNQSEENADNKDGMDISLIRIDRKENKAQWAGANNPLWIIRKENLNFITVDSSSPIEEIEGDKMPIAVHLRMNDFTNHELNLYHGDRIFLFTDGFPDQFGGPKGKKFLYKNFKKLLSETASLPIKDQGCHLELALNNWCNYENQCFEQTDDITLIGIEM